MNSKWIPTMCYQCKAECAILARVEDGVLKEIRGNPRGRGKACVKGMAGVSLDIGRVSLPQERGKAPQATQGVSHFTPPSSAALRPCA